MSSGIEELKTLVELKEKQPEPPSTKELFELLKEIDHPLPLELLDKIKKNFNVDVYMEKDMGIGDGVVLVDRGNANPIDSPRFDWYSEDNDEAIVDISNAFGIHPFDVMLSVDNVIKWASGENE